MFLKFYQEEEGQTIVEYALLISLLALVAIVAIAFFGQRTAGMWGNNANSYPDPPA